MTKSPFFNVDTSRPVSSTTPTNSWPIGGTTGRGRHVVVRVQVRAANARPDDPYDRVRRLLQCRIGHGFDSNVSGAVHDGCSHGVPLLLLVSRASKSTFRRGPVDCYQSTPRLAGAGVSVVPGNGSTSLGLRRSSNVNCMDNRAEIREFLSSRRARITPEQAGLPAYGGNRRVKGGLRREEVALLAGVSIDYYVRMERGNLAGASDSVLESLSRALQLDEAETAHLYDLAKAASAGAPSRKRPAPPRA